MSVHILLLIYISVLGAVIYLGILPIHKKNHTFVVLSMVAIFLVQALRGPTVGWDTAAYINGFKLIRLGIEVNWEPVFVGICKLISVFTSNPQWMIACCSLIIVIGLGYFCLKTCSAEESAFWPVFLFASMEQYFSTMNLLRQSCAMAIGMNIYVVLKDDNTKRGYIKAIGLLLLAVLMHTSAILYILLFIPFLLKRISAKTIITGAVICIAVVFSYSYIIDLFFAILPQYARYKYSFRYNGVEISNYYLMIIFIKIIIVALVVRLKPSVSGNKEIYRLVIIALFSICINLMQPKISLAIRLGYYFDIFIMILIPKFINKLGKYKFYAYFIVFISGWLYFLYLLMETSGGTRGCVPYVFFWE